MSNKFERPVADLTPEEIAAELDWLIRTQGYESGGLHRGRGPHFPITENDGDDDDDITELVADGEDDLEDDDANDIRAVYNAERRAIRRPYTGDYKPSRALEDARLTEGADYTRRQRNAQETLCQKMGYEYPETEWPYWPWPHSLIEWLRQRAQYPEYDYLIESAPMGINRDYPKGRAELERLIAEFTGPVTACQAETTSEMLARRPVGRPRQDPAHDKTGAERTREWRQRKLLMQIVITPTTENKCHDDDAVCRTRTGPVRAPVARPVDRATKAPRKRTGT